MENEPCAENNTVDFCSTDKDDICGKEVDCSDMEIIIEDSPLKSNKRTYEDCRERSSDEEWQTVSRGRKIIRKIQTENAPIQVCVTASKALPRCFAFGRLLKENNIKGLIKSRWVHAYRLLLTFEDDYSADFFMGCKTFKQLEWNCQKTSEIGTSYGVIKNVELEVKDEEMIENMISDVEIVSAKRLDRRDSENTSGWAKSETVRLGFRGSKLPSHIYIQGLRVKVDQYVYPVTQCSRCWKFGHIRKLCPSKKIVCPKCSNDHANCDETSYRCVNCTEDHMPMQKICPVSYFCLYLCPVYKKERKIRELMAENNCTYRQALSMYVPPSPVPERELFSPLLPDPSSYVPKPKTLVRDGEVAEPKRDMKLLSDLFKAPVVGDEDSSKPVQNRKKAKKPRQAPRSPSPCLPAPPMETDIASADKCPVNDNQNNNERSNKPKEFSFVRFFIEFKNILFNKDLSVSDKVRDGITALCELFTHLFSNISINSLMAMFMNLFMNEHG